jgi:hypothetical protein
MGADREIMSTTSVNTEVRVIRMNTLNRSPQSPLILITAIVAVAESAHGAEPSNSVVSDSAFNTDTPRIAEPDSPRHRHAPVRNLQMRTDGSATSDTWSGYAVTGDTGSVTNQFVSIFTSQAA